MSKLLVSPQIARGFYPERRTSPETKFDAAIISLAGNAARPLLTRYRRFASIVPRVHTLSGALSELSDQALREKADTLRRMLQSDGLRLESATLAFALVREVAGRKLGMRHFDVQLIGGIVLLNGMVAEMATGEGKTLTATLPACTAALAGIPVHVITVNDYLARRDGESMKPVYEALGLSVGIVTHDMSPEDRRAAYRCDVTYCTNKDVVFDYLKDRILMRHRPGHIQMRLERLYRKDARLEQLLLRGLPFAIVDEADSVLIDEARTPLIISGPASNSCEKEGYQQALVAAGQLESVEHYTLEPAKRTLELTEHGKERIRELMQPLGGIWVGKYRREDMVRQALMAKHLFIKDQHYIVRDDKVQIVDEYTGRVMADRSWEQGLHQLIECKEGCEITSQNETLARISYQRFFRRYHHLAGMTGTAREVAGELWSVYRLRVVPIPTNKPLVRRAEPFRLYQKAQEKWQAIVNRIAEIHRQERPVLVGTRSVAASEHLSWLLTEAALPHRVLNARQDKEEADIIAEAGRKGRITVATNMAGRGTDIILTQETREAGGLHVLATEFHDSKRIDRQLFGRCGRQGDPGSYEAIASLEDSLFAGYTGKPVGLLARRLVDSGTRFGRFAESGLVVLAQQAAQRKHSQVRRELLKFDDSLESAMAFSGFGE
jgi:preprotein translocase subunit SecA